MLYFSLLILTTVSIRLLTYWFGFPDNYNDFYLFSDSLYKGGIIDKSLGDIFINVSLLFWILFFFIMNIQNKIFKLKKEYQQSIFLLLISSLLALMGYLSILYIYKIVNISTLEFDTTNTSNLTPFMIIGLGTLLLIFMNYVLATIIYNKYFDTYAPNKYLKYYVPIIAIIVVYFLTNHTFFTPFLYGAILTVVLILFLNSKFLNSRFDFNSYKLVYWIIFLSLSCVLYIYHFEAEKEIQLRKKFAERIINFENDKTISVLANLQGELKKDSSLTQLNSIELSKN